MTLSKYWRVHLLVLLSGFFVLLPQYAQSANCRSAESFVRSYYGDLERNDVDSAYAKWVRPKKRLTRLVKQIQWTTVNETSVSHCTGRKAGVYVDVTVKAYNKRSERWTGEVSLKSVRGHWKIHKLYLDRY